MHDHDAVGDELVFPHLDFAVGTVVGQREGHNPEYEHFGVIAVEFEDDGGSREFAAELSSPHKLSLVTEEDWQSALTTYFRERRFVHKMAEVLGRLGLDPRGAASDVRAEPPTPGYRDCLVPVGD